MTDKTNKIDTSAHENEYELKKDDALDIALLANVVGKELTQVDKFAVSGLSKATRIDQQKIFNKPQIQHEKPPVESRPQTPPPGLEQLQNVSVNKQPKNTPPPQVVSQPMRSDDKLISQLNSIESRLTQMEKIYTDILNCFTSNTKQVTLTLDKNDKNK